MDAIIAGSQITKEKRHECFGIVAGGAGSTNPEKYQRSVIIDRTATSCPKTNIRLNFRTNTLCPISKPNMNDDGFDYSEDFDGVQQVWNKKIYINLKCIVGKGGSQTRSLREVYWFIEGQLKYLEDHPDEEVCFANILDGDEAHNAMPKFNYLLSHPDYNHNYIRRRIYVGDLKNYFEWYDGQV